MTARRPSRRVMSVTVGQVWAWMIVWGIAAFIPTPLHVYDDPIFYAALGGIIGLGASLTITGAINRRHSRPSQSARTL